MQSPTLHRPVRSIPQALRGAPSAGRWALSRHNPSSRATSLSTFPHPSSYTRQSRACHSSAAVFSPARTEAVSAAVSPAFIDDYDPALFDHAYASLRAPAPTPEVRSISASASASASVLRPKKIEDWLPVRDSDFASEHDEPLPAEFEPPEESADTRPLPPSPPLASFDTALKKPRRKRRTAADLAALEAATPPIPPGTVPTADETRFDWRQRALSATPHAAGRHWFPDAWRSRVQPPMTKVSEVQPLWAEIRRYAEQ